MAFLVTNKNIRIRHELDRKDAEAQGQRKPSLAALGARFGVGKRCAYTWVTKLKHLQHLPAGQKRQAVEAWLNDGRMDAWIKEGAK